MIWSYILTIIFLENLCNIDVPNTTIAVSILCNSITHAYKYVIDLKAYVGKLLLGRWAGANGYEPQQ
jgi:hypothetical protein